MKNICISTETKEELKEIEKILSDISAPYQIYQKTKKSKNRTLNKILETLSFIKFLHQQGIDTVFGAPTLRNRIAHIFFKKKYINYLRALHPAPELATSLSDQIYFLGKKFKLESRLLNPYEATLCLTNSYITESFLKERDIDKNRIVNIGAVFLEGTPFLKNDDSKPRVVFITQAYAEHKHPDADKEQQEVIRHILKITKKEDLKLIIRKHPRDNTDYDEVLKDLSEDYKINTDFPDVFISTLSIKDIAISPFSTMAFELQSRDLRTIFINMHSMPSYDSAFKKNGIISTDWKKIESFSLPPLYIQNKVFSRYNPSQLASKLKSL